MWRRRYTSQSAMAMKAGRSRGKSTEIRLHCVRSSSGMAIMPDFRYRLSLTVTLVVLVAMYASCACAISSDFEWGDDGWTAAGGRHGSVEEVMHAPRLLKAGDTGPGAWSFVAPDQYLGDQRGTIDGVLEYRIGFLGFDGEWEGGEEVFDVEVESMKHGMVLGRRGLVPPKAFMASVQAKLCAQCGWEVAGARGGAPSSHDFERVFASVSAIRIRGGFYTGSEDTYLMSVRLTQRTDTSPRDRAEGQVLAKSGKGAGISKEQLEGQSQVPGDAATESKKEAQGGDMHTAVKSGQTSMPPDIGLYLQGTEGKLGLNDTHLYYAELTSGVLRAVHLRGIQSVEVDDDGDITVLHDGPSESLACGKLRGYDDVGEVARLLEKAKKRTDAYKAKFHMQPSSGDQTGSFSKKNTKSGNNNKKETGHNFSSTAGSPQGAKQGKGKGHENGADSASTRTDSTRNVEKLGEKQEKSKANVREKVSDEFVPMSEGVKSKIAIEEKKLGINRATMLRRVEGSTGVVMLMADGIIVVSAGKGGKVSSKSLPLSSLTLKRKPGSVVFGDGAKGEIALTVDAFPFQGLMGLIDDASRLMGLR